MNYSISALSIFILVPFGYPCFIVVAVIIKLKAFLSSMKLKTLRVYTVLLLGLFLTALSSEQCTEEKLGDCDVIEVSRSLSPDEADWKDVLLFPDGEVYSGDVINGKQNGVGRGEEANGNRYDGEWKDGVKSGAGKYKWKDGRTYQGEFRDDAPNGMGMLRTPDGASYIGMWENGSKHGRGRYRWPNGRVYEGEWVRGVQHGYGKLYAPPSFQHSGTNGNVGDIMYEGRFENGSPIESESG